MNKFIIFIAILCIFTKSSYAVLIAINYFSPDSVKKGIYKCDSLNILQELDKISKSYSAKDTVIANYCLHSKKDSTWELLFYEQIIPLSINVQRECTGSSIAGKIDLGIKKIFSHSFTGGGIGFCMKTCTGNKEACEKRSNVCKIDISEKYNIYDYINMFSVKSSCLKETSHLLSRHLPIKWDLEISCDTERIPIVGNYFIYISNICTEEQLEKNKKYDKWNRLKEEKSKETKEGSNGVPQ